MTDKQPGLGEHALIFLTHSYREILQKVLTFQFEIKY